MKLFNFFKTKSSAQLKVEEMLKEKSAADWLKPPQREFSEEEHQLAFIRSIFENVLFDIFYDMSTYIRMENGIVTSNEKTLEAAKQKALEAIEEFDEYLKDWSDDNDWWDGFAWNDQVKDYLRTTPYAMHAGDCTAFPSTCDRCLGEEIYKVPFTANWSKHVGNLLFSKLK